MCLVRLILGLILGIFGLIVGLVVGVIGLVVGLVGDLVGLAIVKSIVEGHRVLVRAKSDDQVILYVYADPDVTLRQGGIDYLKLAPVESTYSPPNRSSSRQNRVQALDEPPKPNMRAPVLDPTCAGAVG